MISQDTDSIFETIWSVIVGVMEPKSGYVLPSILIDTYSSGQNKVPTAELKSRLIVVQKSFDSRLIVVL